LKEVFEKGDSCHHRRVHHRRSSSSHAIRMEKVIYLAGPDCFRGDAFDHLGRMKEMAQQKGIKAMSPLDSEVDIEAADIMETIFRINLEDVDQAQVVVANVQAFRGACVDDGTAFELGVACAKGKSIVLYTPTADTPLRERMAADFTDPARALYFEQDKFPRSEDFPGAKDKAGPVNLMITEACRASKGGAIFKTYEEALDYLAREDCPCFNGPQTGLQTGQQQKQSFFGEQQQTGTSTSPLDVNGDGFNVGL
jgi:nucleoside 2-deoxyribosyltransferase